MATKTFKSRIQNKHDTEAHWNAAVNFKPLAGELIIYDEDNTHSTPRFKVGDGNTLVNNLPFYPSGDVTAAGNNTFTGSNTFTEGVEIHSNDGLTIRNYDSDGQENKILYNQDGITINAEHDIKYPAKSGTFAVTNDIDVTAAGNNTFTGSNKFTQKPRFNSGLQLGFTASAPEVNDLWEIDKEGFKAAGSSLSTQTIKFPDLSTFFTANHTIPLNDTDNTFTGKILINTDPVLIGGHDRYKTIDFSNYDSIKVGWKKSNTLDSDWYSYTRYADGAIYRSPTGLDNATYTYTFPNKNGTLALTSDIPDTSNFVTLSGAQTISGIKKFTGTNIFTGDFSRETRDSSGVIYYKESISDQGFTVGVGGTEAATNTQAIYGHGTIKVTAGASGTGTLYLPVKTGTLAVTDDIDVTAAGNNTFTGTNTFQTETSGNLYRTLINQDGVSVGGGPGSIVLDITYGFDNIKRLYGDTTYTYTFPNKNGIFATMNDIPNVAPLAKLAQDNTFTGSNTFNNGGFKVNSSSGIEALNIDPLNSSGTGHTGMTTLKSAIDQYCSIELGAGTLSISSKGTNNSTGHIDISTGSNGVDFNIAGVTSALKVLSDGIKVNSKTKYCGGKIDNIVSGTTYSLTLPSKSGTLALTNDIPIKTATLSGTTLSITLS